jgi:hypothetical protein
MNIAWRSFAWGNKVEKIHNQSKKMKSQEPRGAIVTEFKGPLHMERTYYLHNQKFEK